MSSTVWVPVLASMKGFIAEVNKGADQASKSAAGALEKGLSDAGRKGGQSAATEMARAVETQTKKVVAARQREAGATAQLATAETSLDNLRKRGDASASQIAAAEARVESARSLSETMSARVQAAEKDLDSVRAGGEARTHRQVSAENNLADAKLKAEDAARKVTVAETKAAEEKDKAATAADRVKAAELNLIDTRDRYGANTKETTAAEKELDRARREADSAAVHAVKAEGDVSSKRTAAKSATDTLKASEMSHKAALEDVERASREAASATDDMGESMSGAESKTTGLTAGLGGLVKNALGIGSAIMGVQGIGSALSSGFDRFTTIEDATASMTVIMGDAAKAADLAAGIQESVTGTPFNLDQFMDAGKNLAAFGIEADKIPSIMRAVGEAGAASGKGAEGVGRITDSLGKMSAKGKVSLDEIWSISESGVDALTILANGFDVSTDEMQKMISKGAVPAAEAIDLLTTGIMEGSDGIAGSTNSLEGTMESLRGTLSGTLGGMRSAMSRAGASLVEASLPLIQAASAGITWLANSLSSMVKWLQANQPVAVALGIALGAVVSGLVAFNVAQKITAAGGLAQYLLAAGSAAKKSALGQALLNKAMWMSPITWLVAGIAAVVAGLVLFFTKTETGRQMWSAFTDALAAGWEWVTGKITAGIDIVKAAWGELTAAFSDGDDGYGALASLIGEDAAEWAVNTLADVKAAWDELTAAFRGGDEGYGGLAALIGEDAAEWAVNALASVKDAWGELKAAFSGGDDGYGALSAIFGDEGAEGLANTVAMLGDGLRTLGEWLAKAGEAAMEAGASLGSAVWETAKSLFSALVDVGKALFGSFVEIAGAVWGVVQALAPILLPILKVVAAVIGGVLLVGIVAVVGAFRLIAEVIKVAASVISWLSTTILAPLIGVVGKVIAVIASMPGIVIGVVTSIVEWFSNLKENVSQIFSDIGTAISGWWSEHVEPLPGKVSGAVDTIKQFFSDLASTVLGAFADMGRVVSDWWTTKVEPLPGQIATAVSGVITNLSKLPGQMAQLFSDAGSWLVNSGRTILNGLWEGMKQGWSSLKSWISDTLSFSSIGSLVGLRSGGIVAMAEGGVTRAYIDGGIDQLEAYANGGRRGENHVAQIAPAGAWRVWAEPETGGEAYIPLAESKRGRSMAILDEVAGRFGYTLVESDTGKLYTDDYSRDLGPQHVTAFADGAVVSGDDLLSFARGSDVGSGRPSRSLHDATYDWGGVNWGDCSGTMSAFANTAVGRAAFGSRFATSNEASALSGMGFIRGRGNPGDLRIGFKDGGPGGGHTSGTLPDGTNVEMGGAAGGGSIGPRAAGAWDSYYDTFFHLPVSPGFEKVELDEWGDLPDDSTYGAGQPTYGTVTNTGGGGDVFDPTTAAPSSPQEAAAYGTAVARSVFADEMGGKSLLEIGAEGIFEFLGMSDSLTAKLALTPLDELMPVPQWYGKTNPNTGTSVASERPSTSLAEDHAIALHDEAVTTMTPAALAGDPQLSNIDNPDVHAMDTTGDWGPDFFTREIVRAAQDRELPAKGAAIGVATAVVEVGETLRMLANQAVPESLKYRHDGLGTDHDSIGLFQQRDNGAWGTVAQRMDAYDSAGMFFDALLQKYPDSWATMDPGAVAQGVQVSAYPSRYATQMADAQQLVLDTGLYDQGGVLNHGGLALNLSRKPEAILTNDQWEKIGTLGEALTGPTGTGDDTDAGITLVVNIDGDEVLVKRVDLVENKVTVNEKELRKLKTQRASSDFSVNVLA